MTTKIKNFQFFIRLFGSIAVPILLLLSDYQNNIPILIFGVALYITAISIVHFHPFNEHISKRIYHFMFYLDVLVLSAGIIARGGLRSDFFLGYFLIFGYAMLVREEMLMIKLSIWVSICYTGVVLITSSGDLDIKRLIIRLVLVIGIAYSFQKYVDELILTEVSKKKALDMAHTDPMTHAYNRRMITHISNDSSGTFSFTYIALLDLDDFKKINDSYGHDAGDEVIKTLVKIIYDHLNQEHLCVRYGGEEFLIFFEDITLEKTQKIIDTIRDDFTNHPFNWLNNRDSLTFTAGIAPVIQDKSLEDAITSADKALYTGKTRGKNCTIIL